MKLARRSLAILAVALLAGCDAPCRTSSAEAFPSPGGKYIAWVFKYRCGTSVPASRQVSILPAWQPLPLHECGNTYSQYRDVPVRVRWLDGTDLEIVLPAKNSGTRHRPPVPIMVHYATPPNSPQPIVPVHIEPAQ